MRKWLNRDRLKPKTGMENENIKNELSVIEVNGHRVKTSSTGDITFKVRGKLKKFKSFRIVEMPQSFIDQELQKKYSHFNGVQRALFNAWVHTFEPLLRPGKIFPLRDIMFKKSKYLREEKNEEEGKRKKEEIWQDSFHLSTVGLKKQDPVARMQEFIEPGGPGTDKINKNFPQLFQEASGFFEEKKFNKDELRQIINDLVNLDEKIGEYYLKSGRKNLSEAVEKAKNEYFENLRKRVPKEELNDYKRNVGKILEAGYLSLLEEIANDFAEKLKLYVTDKEIEVFRFFNARQEIFGEKTILWYDLKNELLNAESIEKELKIPPILGILYETKEMDGHNFEDLFLKALDLYLKTIGSKRTLTRSDLKEKRNSIKERKRVEHSCDDNIPSKNGDPGDSDETYGDKLRAKVDMEQEVQVEESKNEFRKKLDNFIESLQSKHLTQAEIVRLLKESILNKGEKDKITREEIAQRIECSHQNISKHLKDIAKKVQKFGFNKNELSILSKQPIFLRYDYFKNYKYNQGELNNKELEEKMKQKSGPVKIIRKAES